MGTEALLSPNAVFRDAVRGARGAVFRDARGERTARGARGVCGAVFRDTPGIRPVKN